MPAKLAVGDPLPPAILNDQHGKPVALDEARAERWLVLFFYPKDGSAVCTKEACAFRDAYQDFQDAGAEVIGISSDSVDSHQRFAQTHRLPFPLLSDPGGQLRNAWGVPKTLGFIDGRVTYLVDPQGIIRLAFSDMLNADRHMKEALALLK